MSVLRSGLLLTPLLASGCNGVLWGNLGVLCVTIGIFLGTVFLSRTGKSGSSRSSASTSHHS
jgi:hypothetical protein